jgi:hypothetical protein
LLCCEGILGSVIHLSPESLMIEEHKRRWIRGVEESGCPDSCFVADNRVKYQPLTKAR